MSDKATIKASLKEAALYRRQGLLVESKEKYIEALALIESSPAFQNDKSLIDAVGERIQSIEKDLREMITTNETVELTPDVKNLILDLFSFSKDEDTAAVEGAVALAQFGQHENALTEFRRLLDEGTLPLLAAKNILRCHLNLESPEEAIADFTQWLDRGMFPKRHLKNIREFLVKLFEKKGMKADLPEVIETVTEKVDERSKEEVLDISLVTLQLEDGPRRGDLAEFDVSFQTGNTVCFSIPAERKELVEAFEPGTRLQNLQCYTVVAVFNGSGVVSGKTKIESGPNQGDYALDITIDGESAMISQIESGPNEGDDALDVTIDGESAMNSQNENPSK
jgi:tetratricopeptide (TPR) repeat protein